jgi:acyl-coenzyme A thioesterase PaaI-like protein
MMSTPVFDLDLLPFAALLGVTVTRAAPDHVEGRLVVRPDLCTAGGILHVGRRSSVWTTRINGEGGRLVAVVTQTQMTVD